MPGAAFAASVSWLFLHLRGIRRAAALQGAQLLPDISLLRQDLVSRSRSPSWAVVHSWSKSSHRVRGKSLTTSQSDLLNGAVLGTAGNSCLCGCCAGNQGAVGVALKGCDVALGVRLQGFVQPQLACPGRAHAEVHVLQLP